METTSNLRNNNHNSNVQSSSKSPHLFGSSGSNSVFVCIPHTSRSVQSLNLDYFSKIKDNSIYNSNFTKKGINNLNNASDEPIDLTCSEKRRENSNFIEENDPNHDFEDAPNVQESNQNFIHENVIAKRKGRKRKCEIKNEQLLAELTMPSLEPNLFKTLENPDYFQIAGNKQTEVLKAAKSLFSKRTRTLYHWMYPNTPKTQLKAAVASSWETLGVQEKEFYISQVLGRFGFPQTNLMVNPQLGGLSSVISIPPLDLTTISQEGTEETSSAVSSLLISENDHTHDVWASGQGNSEILSNRSGYMQRINRKGRLGRPPGSKNRKQMKEEFALLRQIRDDSVGDEFQDDPELRREFEQFKWTLHLNDNTGNKIQ